MAGRILFDFDGTLVDSFECAFAAFQRVGPAFGCPLLSREELEPLRERHALEIMHTLRVPPYRLPQLAARMRREMREDLLNTAPVAGMADTLEALLRRGDRLGIISSNARSNVRDYVRRHRLPGLQDVIGGTGLFGKARVLRSVARRAKVRPERMLYVGDELRDLEAARAAGMRFAAVAWGYTPLARLAAAGAEFQCQRPRDLLTCRDRLALGIEGEDSELSPG
ncbi:haloacid dehalogenase [Thiocapsa imhoffii]|uniref:Haloacid dehalogenase n=1 Tax=Thiocapsa imhoffii TaxID=382777 RepID=A0A9X0WH80_9GAMM|nr:HAD hydrolase-like protein [Thiocapsa imhoffii]MBK1644654.1 haloacid dehalogenase [Thiocapsa imhoffii]